jgi:hypothetical protein
MGAIEALDNAGQLMCDFASGKSSPEGDTLLRETDARGAGTKRRLLEDFISSVNDKIKQDNSEELLLLTKRKLDIMEKRLELELEQRKSDAALQRDQTNVMLAIIEKAFSK